MKKWIAGLLCLLLSLAALCAGAEETASGVRVYYPAGDAYVGARASGAGLAPAALSESCVFEAVPGADGYFALLAKEGYLTSGPTGNALGFSPELSDCGLWMLEDCGVDGACYLRNKGAMYGTSAQYLEFYSGRVTTYGLRGGGSAYVFALVPAEDAQTAQAEAADALPFALEVLFTGDIHGQLYHTEYQTGASGAADGGLTRLASRIRETRARCENTLLIDVGDLVQGTPLTYYYCFEMPGEKDPAILALRALGYDALVLGNHEFNYGLPILRRQMAYAESAAGEGETPVSVLAANYRLEDGRLFAGACLVKEYACAGETVRVGVIGLSTPNIPNWEAPSNYEGMAFQSFLEAWEDCKDALASCDLVIAACHSGVEGEDERMRGGVYADWSNQIRALVENTSGIDLVLGGHSHETGAQYLKNQLGERVPVVFSGSRAAELGVAHVEYSPETGEVRVKAHTEAAVGAPADEALAARLAPYEDACWDEYMNEVIGESAGDFESAGNMLAPCAFLDFVNQVQIEYGYDRAGYTETARDDAAPMFSISAALNSGDGLLIPEGEITYGQLFQLYRFENWLYTVNMTGVELRAWLEAAAARQYGVDANGSLYGGGAYCDCLYGEGLYYEIDMAKAPGERVCALTYLGEPLADDEFYTAVMNNYRYTGGGGYAKYAYEWLNARGLDTDFVAHAEDSTLYAVNPERCVFSTQYGMFGGEDSGQVRNLIADYIRASGEIAPVIVSNWKVYLGA